MPVHHFCSSHVLTPQDAIHSFLLSPLLLLTLCVFRNEHCSHGFQRELLPPVSNPLLFTIWNPLAGNRDACPSSDVSTVAFMHSIPTRDCRTMRGIPCRLRSGGIRCHLLDFLPCKPPFAIPLQFRSLRS